MTLDPRKNPDPPSRDGPVVETLNRMLRGEISAAETYRIALEHLDDGWTKPVRDVHLDHGRHAQLLRDRIRDLGGEPADTSGAWGTWARLIESAAALVSSAAALAALREGEEHGLKQYETELSALDPSSNNLVRERLIPHTRQHISVLNELIEKK